MHVLCTTMGTSIYIKGVDYMQLATLHTLKVNYISQSHHTSPPPLRGPQVLPVNGKQSLHNVGVVVFA